MRERRSEYKIKIRFYIKYFRFKISSIHFGAAEINSNSLMLSGVKKGFVGIRQSGF